MNGASLLEFTVPFHFLNLTKSSKALQQLHTYTCYLSDRMLLDFTRFSEKSYLDVVCFSEHFVAIYSQQTKFKVSIVKLIAIYVSSRNEPDGGELVDVQTIRPSHRESLNNKIKCLNGIHFEFTVFIYERLRQDLKSNFFLSILREDLRIPRA